MGCWRMRTKDRGGLQGSFGISQGFISEAQKVDIMTRHVTVRIVPVHGQQSYVIPHMSRSLNSQYPLNKPYERNLYSPVYISLY